MGRKLLSTSRHAGDFSEQLYSREIQFALYNGYAAAMRLQTLITRFHEKRVALTASRISRARVTDATLPRPSRRGTPRGKDSRVK